MTLRVCDSQRVEMGAVGEDDSLATLVADLDDSFWDPTLTPDNSPRKPNKARTSPLKKIRHIISADDNVDVLQGVQDRDRSNILSEPTLLNFHSRSKPLDHTRCTVESIDELYSKGRYQKARVLLMVSRSFL